MLEKRDGCCRTDGPRRVLSCQVYVAHDSRSQRRDQRRNQRRVKSLSAFGLLSACVRLRQLREVHDNLQQALNPCSRT